ncbi:MAG: DUF1579 family protein [Phycisphaerales bacterium]|nr:MAG: DUF1579 family protein [Phycisphaerales bacterium]
MTRNRMFSVFVAGLTAVALVGCGEPQPMDMQEMKAPPRPAELDKLNCFVGTWEGEYKMTMPGAEEPMTGTSKGTMEWRFNDMFLVEESVIDMGEMGIMNGMAIWGWDPKAKKYRTWWFSDWGEASSGTAEYEEKEKTWEMKAKYVDPMSGKMAYGEGEAKMIDENTMEWSFKQWDNAMHWGTPMEMTGTGKRVK